MVDNTGIGVNLKYCPFCGPEGKDIAVTSLRSAFQLPRGSGSTELVWYRCHTCDALFVYPPPTFREIEAHLSCVPYGDLQQANAYSRAKSMVEEKVERWVVRRFGSDGRVLDFGCGFGSLLGRLKKRGYEAIGIDANAAAVDAMRANGYDVRHTFDLEDARFPDAWFDALLVIDSFCFVLHPHRFLSEAARIVKPGGLLIMRISNYRLPVAVATRLRWSRVGRRLLRRGLRDQYHVIGLRSLEGLLRRKGFLEIHSSPRAWTVPLREAEWVTRGGYAGGLLLWALTAGKLNIAPGVLLRCTRGGLERAIQ